MRMIREAVVLLSRDGRLAERRTIKDAFSIVNSSMIQKHGAARFMLVYNLVAPCQIKIESIM